MTAIDQLLAVLRTTLAEPPAIVLEAEKELASLRDENERMRLLYDLIHSTTEHFSTGLFVVSEKREGP